MALGAGVIAKLVTKLIQGGAVDALLSKKLEELGEDFIRSQLSGSFGFLADFAEGDFAGQRDAWLNKITKSPIPNMSNPLQGGLITKIFNIIEQGEAAKSKGKASSRAKWTRSAWANSRNDWLDNHWKHDWRSQPRDPVSGRWLAGRLENVDAALQARGVKAGRATKRRRKLRRRARMRGRKAAKQMFRG